MLWHSQFAATVGQRWTVGIGDPSVYGWATVVGYIVAGLLCLAAAAAAPRMQLDRGRRRLRVFFAAAGLCMLALAINKQLDLQSLATQIGKDIASKQGWYSQRRVLQHRFVYTVAGMGGLMALIGLVMLRGLWAQAGVALFGVCVTVTFIVIRAASFHHVDHAIGRTVLGVRVNVLLELSGLVLTGLGAVLCLRRARPRDTDHPSTRDRRSSAAGR